MNTGQQISHYRILGPIGKGGMGEVFEAEDLRLGRRVALKFLPDGTLDETKRKRFLNEARLAAQLHHPHICPIFDVEETEGRIFIAMALIEGETLSSKIRSGPLPLEDVLRWSREVLSGLEAAHAAGIVHRDIKSSNLIVDREGRVAILDFGLAQRGGEERLTQAGLAVGTPAYMAPEQLRGEEVDERADLWAFGMVLFEMLTGKLPQDSLDHLWSLKPGLPAALDQFVSKARAARPADRWQSAREMRLALDAFSFDGNTKTIVAVLPKPASSLSTLWPLGAIVLLALSGWVFFGQKTARPPVAAPVATARRVAILPLKASSDSTRALGDGLLELLTESIGEAERAGQPIWAVPVGEVQSRKLASPEEARRAYGVGLAVQGAAVEDGKQLRLTLDLVDTSTLKQVGQQSFLYDPATPTASRERAFTSMRKLLSLDALATPSTAAPSGDAYSAYLEGRGLINRFDRSGNLNRAIERFTQAVKLDPNFALAHASLGEATWMKAKDLNNSKPELATLALDHARRAVALAPQLPLTHIKLAGVLSEMARQEEAIQSLNRALELAPGNAEAARSLAAILHNQGKEAEAEKLYLASIRERPTDWLGHLELAFFYEDSKRLEEAERELVESGKYAPENETVVRNLGRIYRMQGRYKEAVAQLMHAAEMQPSSRAYNSLGFTYYLLRDYPKAVAALEEAIDLDGNFHQYWGNLGAASAMSAEHKGKSVPALRKAAELAEARIKMTPSAYSVLADLAEYRARLGDAKSALAAIAKIPEKARETVAGRIVLSYELIGNRVEAIRAFRAYFKNPLAIRGVLDEPSLEKLRADADFERAVEELKAKSN